MKKIIRILMSIYLSVFNILVAVTLILNYRDIYKLAIKILGIDQLSNVSPNELYLDYCNIIDFINHPKITELSFKNFTISNNAVYHFTEVRNIFINIYVFIMATVVLFIALMIYDILKKRREYKLIVKNSFIINISITIVIAILSTLDFSNVFEYFHKIIFANDYWLFDTVKDSIILALPEEFFFMCTAAILIISIIVAMFELIIIKLLPTKE